MDEIGDEMKESPNASRPSYLRHCLCSKVQTVSICLLLLEAMDWERICSCLRHEMYPMLSSAVKKIVDDDENGLDAEDVSDEAMEAVIDILRTKRRIGNQEISYLKELVQRARDYQGVDGGNDEC